VPADDVNAPAATRCDACRATTTVADPTTIGWYARRITAERGRLVASNVVGVIATPRVVHAGYLCPICARTPDAEVSRATR
jgi:hypothetical protein